jgi:TolB-like protein/DNA-binding winged helix-turn-helix (wHTH) protein
MTGMIHFGAFSLDPRSGELRRDDEIVPLPPQPGRLLVALAGRPGELVTRDELRQLVWDEGTNVDFERGLNFCILQVRNALGDDAKNPVYIETLPKRGYRFVAPVTVAGGAAGFRPPDESRWARARRSTFFIAAVLLVAILFAIAWQRREPAPARTMIAVLPFDGDTPFAEGMTDELLTHLGALQPQRLGVIARTSTLTYRGTKKSVRDIGRELGVAYVVEGSVRREGNRVRVAANLVDARDQTQLWSESFDREGPGALAIQRDIAEKIADALRIELIADDVLTAKSPAAHEAYLRGRQLWSARGTDSMDASVRELREAVRLEPSFVLAHVALAESLHLLAMRERIGVRQASDEIRAASDAALRLAPSLAQSHAITAMHRFWYAWDWEGAEESYRQAVRLNPNEPGALHDHGWLLITRGAFDEGLQQIRRAQELDPVSPRANMHVAWAYIYTRRYDDAIRESRRALALSPGFAEALGCIEHAEMLRAGRRPTEPPRVKADPYSNAVNFALAGDRETALSWLVKAKEARNTSFPLAGVDPKLDALNGDPRFDELLRSAGLTRRTRSDTSSPSRASRRS